MKGIVGSEISNPAIIRLPTEDRLATIICMQFGYLAAFARHDIEDHLVGEAHRVGAGSTLPYLDFGARMYDAKLVRWNTYDPMAEKYYGVNAYGYCLNNPIRYFDPTGQKPKDVIMGGIPADKDDYNYGLQVADLTSGVVGVIMIASGEGGQTAGGGLVAVGAGVAATGIGAPEGGIAALGGIVAVAGGVVLEAGGMYILANLLREIRRALIKCKRMLIEAGLPKESKDNAALNKDGTWKNSQTDYLRQNG